MSNFLLRVTEAFHKQNIKYAIVGGYAVAFHGVHRATVDVVDILLNHDLSEVSTVLKSVHGKRVSICQIDDLIRIKKQAGRDQDKEDVKSLLEIKEEIKK